MAAASQNQTAQERDNGIVDSYLPQGYSAETIDTISSADGVASSTVPRSPSHVDRSSLTLQGGDVHRDVFKIKAKANKPKRAATFAASESTPLLTASEPTVQDQQAPGGLRRQFLQRRPLGRTVSLQDVPIAASFVTFLDLYGNFAGEDLADTDEGYAALPEEDESTSQLGESTTLPRPSLGRRKSSKRNKREGDAGTTKTFFTLLKAFVGTGIMFLPKAFRNGGILFSSITLISVSILSTVCFRLLLQSRKRCAGGSYGDIGASIIGPHFRILILASIALSQLGFVCTGIIFTAENLFAVLEAVSRNRDIPLSSNALIVLQLVVLIPLAWIRNISKLGSAALVADIFILVGLVYIWSFDISKLIQDGIAPSITLFNPSAFTLTIGSAIFTFEGIGLILPIQSSMRNPAKFSHLLYLVMLIVTVVFTSIGALCYATFGENTKIQIMSNFPQTSKVVNMVQFLYSLAVLVGGPVQLFPAVRIIETSLFGEHATGKQSTMIKWKKNALRTSLTILCVCIAILGASDLDKFVALIGSFACVPLVYIYPPLLHLRGCAKTRQEKSLDSAMIGLGLIAMVYTTVVTLGQWVGAR